MGLSEGDALVRKANILLFHAADIEGPLFESTVETVSRVNHIVRHFLRKFHVPFNKYINYEIGSSEKIYHRMMNLSRIGVQ